MPTQHSNIPCISFVQWTFLFRFRSSYRNLQCQNNFWTFPQKLQLTVTCRCCGNRMADIRHEACDTSWCDVMIRESEKQGKADRKHRGTETDRRQELSRRVWIQRHKISMNPLLTYAMVQSPSWEANRFAASQEIPRISRNPKVHYRTHKRPPPVSILGQPNPVQIPISNLLEIHPNIIHPSTPRSPHWYLSLRFPHQDPIHPPLLAHTRHTPSPSHSSRFYVPNTSVIF